MPGGDRTGPLGEGAMTGRQLGYGAGFDSPGFKQSLGSIRGRGFAFRNRNLRLNKPINTNETDLNQIRNEVGILINIFNSLIERLDSMTEKKVKNNK